MGNKGCFESGCMNRKLVNQGYMNNGYNNQRKNYVNQHQNQNNEVPVIKRKVKKANFDYFQVYSIQHNGKNQIIEDILDENKNISNEQSFSKIIKQKTAESSNGNKENERMVSGNKLEFVRTQSVMEYVPNNGNGEKRRSNAFSITLVGNQDLSGMVLPSNTIKKGEKQKGVLNGIHMPPRCVSYNPNKGKVPMGIENQTKFVKTQH